MPLLPLIMPRRRHQAHGRSGNRLIVRMMHDWRGRAMMVRRDDAASERRAREDGKRRCAEEPRDGAPFLF